MSSPFPEDRPLPTRRACLQWSAAALLAGVSVRAGECPCAKIDPVIPAGPEAPAAHAAGILRVCADPNNLPFSNHNHEGFEDKIAELVARDLGMELQYDWLPQRLGFYREALKTGDSDLVLAAPGGFEKALTTTAYYRSSYVFVARRDRNIHVKSFDDPLLGKLKIGVPLTGKDNTPPAQALGHRGLIDNIVGFPVFDRPVNQAPAIIRAVADKEVDVAIVWGPLAGYFARRGNEPLNITPVAPVQDGPLTFAFDICMGVRRKSTDLRDRLNGFIARRQTDIDAILDEFGVPRLPVAPAPGGKA
jgi:mxaJ protein